MERSFYQRVPFKRVFNLHDTRINGNKVMEILTSTIKHGVQYRNDNTVILYLIDKSTGELAVRIHGCLLCSVQRSVQ